MATCAIAGVTVDPLELYRCEDTSYLMWLESVLDRIARMRRAAKR